MEKQRILSTKEQEYDAYRMSIINSMDEIVKFIIKLKNEYILENLNDILQKLVIHNISMHGSFGYAFLSVLNKLLDYPIESIIHILHYNNVLIHDSQIDSFRDYKSLNINITPLITSVINKLCEKLKGTSDAEYIRLQSSLLKLTTGLFYNSINLALITNASVFITYSTNLDTFAKYNLTDTENIKYVKLFISALNNLSFTVTHLNYLEAIINKYCSVITTGHNVPDQTKQYIGTINSLINGKTHPLINICSKLYWKLKDESDALFEFENKHAKYAYIYKLLVFTKNIYKSLAYSDTNYLTTIFFENNAHPLQTFIDCLDGLIDLIKDDIGDALANYIMLYSGLLNEFINLYKDHNLLYTCVDGLSGNVLGCLYSAYYEVPNAIELMKPITYVFDMGDMDKGELVKHILDNLCTFDPMPSEEDISKFTTALPNLFKFKVAQKTARNTKPITQLNGNGPVAKRQSSANRNGNGPVTKRPSWAN